MLTYPASLHSHVRTLHPLESLTLHSTTLEVGAHDTTSSHLDSNNSFSFNHDVKLHIFMRSLQHLSNRSNLPPCDFHFFTMVGNCSIAFFQYLLNLKPCNLCMHQSLSCVSPKNLIECFSYPFSRVCNVPTST